MLIHQAIKILPNLSMFYLLFIIKIIFLAALSSDIKTHTHCMACYMNQISDSFLNESHVSPVLKCQVYTLSDFPYCLGKVLNT